MPTEKVVSEPELTEHQQKIESLAAHKHEIISVVFVAEMLVEGEQELIALVLGILHHLAPFILGQVLHQASCNPNV